MEACPGGRVGDFAVEGGEPCPGAGIPTDDCGKPCRADLLAQRFEEAAGKRAELYGFVLSELCDGYDNRTSIGRGTIAEKARQGGLYLTEQEVRTILNRLQEKGLVSISRGRGGSRLTGDGLELARSMKRESVQ